MKVFSTRNASSDQAAIDNCTPQANKNTDKTLILEQFSSSDNTAAPTQATHPAKAKIDDNRTLDDGRIEPVFLAAANTAERLFNENNARKNIFARAAMFTGKASLRITTFLLCCAALGILALQWLQPNPNSLPKWPPLQKTYHLACAYLPCRPLVKASDYSINKLQVHNLQAKENTLLVAATITNTSSDTLPLPLLWLQFSTMNKNKFASRLIEPSEYASNISAGKSHALPSLAALNIQFSIVDPGVTFVNYSIEALPPVEYGYSH